MQHLNQYNATWKICFSSSICLSIVSVQINSYQIKIAVSILQEHFGTILLVSKIDMSAGIRLTFLLFWNCMIKMDGRWSLLVIRRQRGKSNIAHSTAQTLYFTVVERFSTSFLAKKKQLFPACNQTSCHSHRLRQVAFWHTK